MRRIFLLTLATSLAVAAPAAASESASLKGSIGSMNEQNLIARKNGLSFYLSPDQVRRAVLRGELVELTGNADYEVASTVSNPYAIPAVRTFVERLAADYREGCGQKLVVTSATRALSQQPRNAHALSVHPAGMAVDLRVSDQPLCRHRLEAAMLELNRQGVINGIREYKPPHYHIAIYPDAYMAYVGEQLAKERVAAADVEVTAEEAGVAAPDWETAAAESASDSVAEAAPVEQGPDRGRALLSLSVTTLMGLVGGGLVLGVRVPTPGVWTPRVRRFAASWTPVVRERLARLAARRG